MFYRNKELILLSKYTTGEEKNAKTKNVVAWGTYGSAERKLDIVHTQFTLECVSRRDESK